MYTILSALIVEWYLLMVAPGLSLPSAENNYQSDHVLLILSNLKELAGIDLLTSLSCNEKEVGEKAFYANFCLLSHDGASDPVLNYGNIKALELWEASWDELTSMQARETAKPDDQATREKTMKEVKENGYLTNYSGIRVSKFGKAFKILDVTIWNLTDQKGEPYGQAALFRDYEFI